MERKTCYDTDQVTVNTECNVIVKEPDVISDGNKSIITTSESINAPHDDIFPNPFSEEGFPDLFQGQGDQHCSIVETHASSNRNQFNCAVEASHSYKGQPPFSVKLRRDKAIKYSKVRVKESMILWLKEGRSLGKSKFSILKSVKEHPTPFILAKFAKKAYGDYDKDLPKGWKLLTTANNDATNNGYFGAVFWNPKQQQVVIAHRGTDPLKWGAIRTDIIGIVFNNCVAQMDSASTFAAHVTSVLIELNKEKKTNFQLFFTGHSLGGWLAQITTFTAKYLSLSNDDNFKLIEADREGYHAHAVVFDSPGCKDMLHQLKDVFISTYDKSNPVAIDSLDITSYLSAPNLINTCNSHLGTLYRIFVDLTDMGVLDKITLKYNLAAHNMDKILKTFSSEDVKMKEVLDWPISKGLGGEELNKFFDHGKHLNNYDPEVNSNGLYTTIQFQEKIVEKNIRNVNVCTQSERIFLEKYQQLRDLPDNRKPQNLFSDVNDEDIIKEIKERLQYFKIDKKHIICRDKGELLKLIPYINTLLYIVPEVKSKVDKALTETCILEAIIDSQSKDYLKLMSNYFQQFTEDEELKTLIRNTKQVSLISAEEEISMGSARIYKTFEGNMAYDGTKHISRLEKLLYLKELLYSKKSMSSFVDVLCRSKSLILVECTSSFKLEDDKDLIGDFLCCIFKKIKDQPETKIIFVVNSSNNGNWNDMIGSKAEELQIEYKMEIGMSPTWDNLSDEFQEELLNRPLIAFEGQKETSLKELMGDNNAAYKDIVSDKEMLLALINNIKIPMELNLPIASDYDARYYVARSFNQQIEVNINTFKETNNENLLVFSCVDKAHLESLGFRSANICLFKENYFTKKNAHKFIIGSKNYAKDTFRQLCTKFPQDNFHWLMFESDKLIWHQSQGDISNLHRYIKKDKSHARKYSEYELLNKNQRIMILSDTAGMGKSVILTKMAIKLNEQKPGSWVIKVNLNDHTKELNLQKDKGSFKSQNKNKATELAIRFITKDLLNFGKSSKDVLCHHYCHLNMEKMILMLDGFDEISPDYKEVVIDLVQALMKTTIKQIWITTRPNIQEEIENAFQQFANTLKPFSEHEQQGFLTKFWQRNLNEKDNEKLQTYARALLKQLENSISDKDKGFTGIPLQTKMLAEGFQEKCAAFCNSKETEPELPENLDIIDLYERFLQQKYKICQEEKTKLDSSKPGVKSECESYSDFIEKHQDMALYALFDEAQLETLFKEKLYEKSETKYHELAGEILKNKDLKEKPFKELFQDKISKLRSLINNIKEGNENMGVIDQVINGKPHFVHRTFAEYLVAKYLMKSLGNKTIAQFVLLEILKQPNYEVIRAFLNDIMAKERISGNILNEYGEQMQKLWLEDRNNLCNKKGFTILHIAASENNAEIVGFLLESITNRKNILTSFLETRNGDCFVKGTALYLAILNGHEKVVQCLVEKGANVNAINNHGDTILHSASEFCKLEIVKYLVEKGADVNAINKDGNTILHSYYRSCKNQLDVSKPSTKSQSESYSEFIERHQDLALYTLFNEAQLEILLREKLCEEFKIKNPKFAEIFQDLKPFNKVIFQEEKTNLISLINRIKEGNENMGVIDQVINGKPHFVHRTFAEYLVAKYLVKSLGNKTITQFVVQEILIQENYEEIRSFLNDIMAKEKISGNIINEYGKQIQKLWSEDRNNLCNKKGFTILHIAASENNVEIVGFLLESITNQKSVLTSLLEASNGDCFVKGTALYLATLGGHGKVVKCLVEKGADVNAINNHGDTILHSATGLGNLEIIKYLVENGADVNAMNKDGNRILHSATGFGNLEIIKYLVEKGADVDAVNKNGDTILHSATGFGNLEILKYLVEKGADADAQSSMLNAKED